MALDPEEFDFCSEVYVVERVVELVVANLRGESEQIRIEALRAPGSSGRKYHARAYIKEDITVQPTYPQGRGKFGREPESFSVWVPYDLPWTDRETADEAIAQALFFLRERCQR